MSGSPEASEAGAASTPPRGPYDRILVVGPDLPKLRFQGFRGYKVIGNGEDSLSFERIKKEIADSGGLKEDANITIFVHGLAPTGKHTINLEGHSVDTRILFQELASITPNSSADPSKKAPLQIHLFSCFGGAAATDVDVLPEGSVLVTHAPRNKSILEPHCVSSILKLAKEGTGQVLHDLMINSLNEKQNFTVAIKLNNGEINSFTLRPPIHELQSPETITRYLHEQWGSEIREKLGSVPSELLPSTVKLDDIPTNPDFLLPQIRDQFGEYKSDIFYTKVRHAESLADWQDLIDMRRAESKTDDEAKSEMGGLLLYMFTEARTANRENVTLLLDNGASASAKLSYTGETPLHYAKSAEVVKLLISRGAEIEAKNARGEAPLNNPFITLEVAHELIKAGASVETRNNIEETPLHRADSPEIAQLLIRNRAQVNAVDIGGNTPLHKARSSAIVKVLKEAGADLDARNIDGETPLFCSLKDRKKDVFAQLLEEGADLTIPDKDGITPLDYAKRYVKTEFVELITRKTSEAMQSGVAASAGSAADAMRRGLSERPAHSPESSRPASPGGAAASKGTGHGLARE